MSANSSRGYSLVELTIVVLILGIVAVVAVPFLSPANEKKLRLAAEQTANAMRYARAESIRLRQPHGVYLQSGEKRLRVFRADFSTSPPTPIYDSYHPVSKQPYDIDFDTSSLAEVTTITLDSNYKTACSNAGQFYFDSDGAPWCRAPETSLLRSLVATFEHNAMQYRIVLDGITGRVSVQ